MPPKTLVKAGIVGILLAAGVFSASRYWLTTRTFEPVNMPVTLEAGKVQTVEFAINLQEDYSIRTSVDYSLDDWTEGRCADKLWQEMDWKVYRLGGQSPKDKELKASSEEMRRQGLWPDGFHGFRGRYALEWSVPASAVCLNARHPRLKVWADPSNYETAFGFVLIACIAMVMAGSGAFLRAVVVWLSEVLGSNQAPRIFPDIMVTNVIPLRRQRPMPLIRDTPNFGLVCGFILRVLMFDFMIFGPRASIGLFADFRSERAVSLGNNPWAETMAVYVDAKRGFFVNGKPVAREELRSRLEEELLRRGVRVVYFEADGNCLYMDAVYAMGHDSGPGCEDDLDYAENARRVEAKSDSCRLQPSESHTLEWLSIISSSLQPLRHCSHRKQSPKSGIRAACVLKRAWKWREEICGES